MDRAAALAYLIAKYPELAAESGLTDEQAYSAALDNALRQLGFSESDLATADVAQEDVRKYLALLDYFALQRFLVAFSTWVSVSLPGPASAQRNQAFSQVKMLFDLAKADLVALGLDPGNTGMRKGRLNLGFLYPACSGDEFAGRW